MSGALLLTRQDIAALMTTRDYLAAVEAAFRAAKEGAATPPLPLHLAATNGGFHAKAAAFGGYAAVKWNGNYPGNPERFELPTIQGAILLCDARNGALLAIMDSIEISQRRTAAASALAAKHLARKDASRLLICGAGEQGRAHLDALPDVLPISGGFVFDRDAERAEALASLARERGMDFRATDDLSADCEVIVTCTPSRAPFLRAARRGTFIAAVGADNPEKAEIAPSLLKRATIIVDDRAQCRTMGDSRGLTANADLGEIVTGRMPGRRSEDEIIVFDSTGVALQDVASAASIFERAQEKGVGATWEIAS